MVWESKSAGGKVKLRGKLFPIGGTFAPSSMSAASLIVEKGIQWSWFGLAIRLTDCNDFDLPR